MKTSFATRSRLFWLRFLFMCWPVVPLAAEQFGLFTYRVVGATVEITDYPDDAVGVVEIPAAISGLPVTSIGDFAFRDCRGLTGVIIPASVTSISSGGRGAFIRCSGLKFITVEPENPSFTGVDGVLFNASQTTLILYPAGIAGAYTIASSVTSIGDSAFSGCNELTGLTIPASVTSIFANAFQSCSNLTSIAIPQGVTSIGSYSFSECTGLTSITLPATVITISPGAFAGCSGLTSVTIPSSVTRIGSYAFHGCTGLRTIAIPSYVTNIEDGTFYRCTGLTNVFIPSSVTNIGRMAFQSCTGLTSITIPPGVTTIGSSAFESCSALTNVTIPSSVTRIESIAFCRCSALVWALFLGDAPTEGFFVFNRTAPGFTVYYLRGHTGFPSGAFYPATMLDEIRFPAGAWLLTFGYRYDADLEQDVDGDGVSLLMAYAFDLDPRLNLKGSLPEPVLDGNTLSLSFHASSPGITYRVEISTDLQSWTSIDVPPAVHGAGQLTTVTVPVAGQSRFLRLKVQAESSPGKS